MRRRLSAARIVLLGVLALGAFLNRAALRGPLALDDFMQRALIEGRLTPSRGPLNLYDFVANDNRKALLDQGAIPWWSDPHLAIRFLRPLPSALVWADHRLFGYAAFGPHVVSFLCWVLAVLAAGRLYRIALGDTEALLASAIFALSPTLTIPLVWLANRDVLLSLAFGASALASYVQWRRHRDRSSGIASAVGFCASALTGEYALCLIGYLIALEISFRGESTRRRIAGSLPALVPLLLYAVVHAALGYGAAGSGLYRDPRTDPAAYLSALPRVLSILLGSTWLVARDTSSWLSTQPASGLLILGGVSVVGGATWLARRGNSVPESFQGAWLASGSVLALLPLAATEPSRRILGIAALGVSGALALLTVKAVRAIRIAHLPSAVPLILAVGLIGYVHLVTASVETRRLSRQAVEDETWGLNRLSTIRPPGSSPDTILVVRANYPDSVLWTPFALRADAPKHWRVLSQTFEEMVAIRNSSTSLDAIEEVGPLFSLGPADMFRTIPFAAGDVVDVVGMRATVLRVDPEGRPKAVRYEFDKNLDNHGVSWISEGQSGFGDVIPPAVGIGVRLAP